MPNKDGTGPLGQGPIAGRGRGKPKGRGRRISVHEGSKDCTCPKCGYKEPHARGIPCSQKRCPKCDTPMTGAFCS